MTWVRLDDGFTEHSKIHGLSDRAFRLHVTALCYCGRNLTDGHITARALKVLLAACSATKRHVLELVGTKVWEVEDDGHQIHDFNDLNPTAAEVREKSRKRQEAGRIGGMKSGEVRRSRGDLLSVEERQRRARAASRANTAEKAGRIPQEDCAGCGASTNVEKHHFDYERPEDVIWLCKNCHMGHHATIRREAFAQANASQGASSTGGLTPVPVPSPVLLKAVPADQEIEHEVDKIMSCLNGIDEGTRGVIVSIARKLPVSAVAKVRESCQQRRVGAGYAVNALRAELADLAERAAEGK